MPNIRNNAVLLLTVSGTVCAIPLSDVVETMRPLPIEPLIGMPEFLRGVAVIRGGPVPVVDLGKLIGARNSVSNRFVTVRVGHRRVALAAEAVIGIAELGEERCADLPPLLRNAHSEVIDKLETLDGEFLMILHTGRLVPEALWPAIEREAAL